MGCTSLPHLVRARGGSLPLLLTVAVDDDGNGKWPMERLSIPRLHWKREHAT